MAIAVIASASGSANANSATTDTFDSTGGEAIIVGGATFGDFDRAVSDSESNSYTQLDRLYDAAGGSVQISLDESVVTGSTHDVTIDGTYSAPCVFAAVITGLAASPYDQASAGTTSTGTTLQPGSITPPQDGCLFVTVLACNSGAQLDSMSIDSGFTILRESFGSLDRGAMAYKVQTTAAAENPTWTAGFGNSKTTRMWTFLPAASGVSIPVFLHHYQQQGK